MPVQNIAILGVGAWTTVDIGSHGGRIDGSETYLLSTSCKRAEAMQMNDPDGGVTVCLLSYLEASACVPVLLRVK